MFEMECREFARVSGEDSRCEMNWARRTGKLLPDTGRFPAKSLLRLCPLSSEEEERHRREKKAERKRRAMRCHIFCIMVSH